MRIHDVYTVYKYWRCVQADVALYLAAVVWRVSENDEQCRRATETLCYVLDEVMIIAEDSCTVECITPRAWRRSQCISRPGTSTTNWA